MARAAECLRLSHPPSLLRRAQDQIATGIRVGKREKGQMCLLKEFESAFITDLPACCRMMWVSSVSEQICCSVCANSLLLTFSGCHLNPNEVRTTFLVFSATDPLPHLRFDPPLKWPMVSRTSVSESQCGAV